MSDPAPAHPDLRARLAALEPLRRRVIRVYWTRGLLVAALVGVAAPLGLVTALASAFFVGRATGRSPDGELALHLAPILLAFLIPLAAAGLGAGLGVLAILRRFGRASVREYDDRYRDEIVSPLLRSALPEASLDVSGHVQEAAFAASQLVGDAAPGAVAGAYLMRGRAEGMPYAASVCRVRGRRGRAPLFQGFFARLDFPGRFEGTTLALDVGSPSTPGLAAVEIDDPAFRSRFEVRARDAPQALRALAPPTRALLLALRERAARPLYVWLHPGGLTFAAPVPGLLRAPRVRPGDPEELARHTGLYALVRLVAGRLAAQSAA